MVVLEKKTPQKVLQVFVPETIPLENKGEEAILRGYEDVLFPGQEVHFHILAYNIRTPTTIGNLTIYPDKWFYPQWVFREVYVSLHPLDILNLLGFLFQGFRNRWPFLAGKAHSAVWLNEKLLNPAGFLAKFLKKRAEALTTLARVDFVLAGHDNAMGIREAHLLQSLSKMGLTYGIFGCGMNAQWANNTVAEVYRSTFKKSLFLYFRDHETWQGIRERGGVTEACLAPDPAFGMRPAENLIVEKFMKIEGLTELFAKPVVTMTVVENAVIMKSFKAFNNPGQKSKAHYKLLGPFVDHIIKNWGVNVLFLPHCSGPTTRLDDRQIARHVIRFSTAGSDTVRILETPCDARMLKGLIQRSIFLIGERIHSLIGSISVGTPFICLGSSSDKRTREIIGNMCCSGDLVYDLNQPSLDSLIAFADSVWKKRNEMEKRVKQVSAAVRTNLEDAAKIARGRITNYLLSK